MDLLTATYANIDEFPIHVVLRKWEPLLDPEFEFRGFVHNKQLTALSQYNHYAYFPEIVERKEELQEAITSYWEASVRAKVEAPSYVVDFAVLTDGRVCVVELNPFAKTTGGALFSWKGDEAVLHNGPFEFRVHEKPVSDMEEFFQYCLEQACEDVDESSQETPPTPAQDSATTQQGCTLQ